VSKIEGKDDKNDWKKRLFFKTSRTLGIGSAGGSLDLHAFGANVYEDYEWEPSADSGRVKGRRARRLD
jgi:hypothetical protein